VLVGASNPLCYTLSKAEWDWAARKAQNWCCPLPTFSEPPTLSPTNLPSVPPTLSPKDGLQCSAEGNCYQFKDLASWNQEFVTSLCLDHGNTDKSMNATLCDAYAGNPDYEMSLKLAILNTMYGTGDSSTECPYWCMYDPLRVVGNDAVGFKWHNSLACWNVLVGATNPLCYSRSWAEWEWATSKAQNWCCPPNTTGAPTLGPSPCSPYSSWNEVRASELCPTTVQADKSYDINVCDETEETKEKLEDSLANQFYTQCNSWCVYDYDTLINNTKTGSSDKGGFIWKNNNSCWKWVTGGFCFTAANHEFEEVSSLAAATCITYPEGDQ